MKLSKHLVRLFSYEDLPVLDFKDKILFKVGRILTPGILDKYNLKSGQNPHFERNMKNRIFDQILDFMVLLDGEFKYESNGSF